METLRCVRWPHGLHVASADTTETQSEAFEAFIPACIIERSSVLQHLSCDAADGASFDLPAPTGYIQTWLLTLPSVEGVFLDVDFLARGIMAADFLEDNQLVQHLCCALGKSVGSYCLTDSSSTHLQNDNGNVPQVLEGLSGPLVATVLRAAPVSLAMQLRRLPPSTHPHAMHAAFPDVATTSLLDLDCSTLDATSATLALTAVASVHTGPLHSLTVRGIATLATLQAPTIPDDFMNAMIAACMGVMHVALDFRELADTTIPGLVAHMDPSATEGMLRGLGGNTALESLEVKIWECGPVAAFLEGGGCARQLKSLKLDIEGPGSEAALQAMAACTALTHLTLDVNITYCCVLAAGLQCMTQLQELHLTLQVQKPAGHKPDKLANHIYMGVISNVRQQLSMKDFLAQLDTSSEDRIGVLMFMVDPLLHAIHFPGFSLRSGNLLQGFRVPGQWWNRSRSMWQSSSCADTIYPMFHENLTDDWPLLCRAIQCLSSLTTLSIQGSWFQQNPQTIGRMLHEASALQNCSISLPDCTRGSSGNLQSIFCTLDAMKSLREISLCMKHPKTLSTLCSTKSCVPAEACSLLRSMQGLGLYSLCTSLQLCVCPLYNNDASIELWEHLKAFTALRRLRLSRIDHVAGNYNRVMRMRAEQESLVPLGAALTRLTYLKIGVSFHALDTSAAAQQGGRGGAGRGRGAGRGNEAQPAMNRARLGEPNQSNMSGLILMLRSLTQLKQLSMYSCGPDSNGHVTMPFQNPFEMRALGEAMQGLTTLSKLSLKGGELLRGSICCCLACLPSLKDLALDGDFCVMLDTSVIRRAFSSLRQLQRLTINRLQKAEALEMVARLLDALPPAGELKELNVGWVLGAGSWVSFKSFTESLGNLTSLQSLSICSVRFVEHCAQFLADALTPMRQLQRLAVDMCELIGSDVLTLYNTLLKLPEVVQFSCYGNRLSRKDLFQVQKSLKGCERLHSVQLGMQMPFVQCPCCDYYTLPQWAFYNGCLGVKVHRCVYLNFDKELGSRWLCPVCRWDSTEAPGAKDMQSLLDKHLKGNRSNLRQARAEFQRANEACPVQENLFCSKEEFARFAYSKRYV